MSNTSGLAATVDLAAYTAAKLAAKARCPRVADDEARDLTTQGGGVRPKPNRHMNH